MLIALGSTSKLKLEATKAACEALGLSVDIQTLATDSGVSSQPVGVEETERGAYNRARAVYAQVPDAYVIGIENGIRRASTGWEDWAVVVLIAPNGEEMVSESAAITFPEDAVEEAMATGFQTTVGQILARRHGCAHDDPHSFLSGGATSRLALLTEALVTALQKL